MEQVLALIGAVASVLSDLLQQDFDEIEDYLPANNIFSEAALFSFANRSARLRNSLVE